MSALIIAINVNMPVVQHEVKAAIALQRAWKQRLKYVHLKALAQVRLSWLTRTGFGDTHTEGRL